MSKGFIQCNDICIHYLEAGSGRPLIFLHGNQENSKYFKEQIAFFEKNYHVYAIDTRGHGLSTRGHALLNFHILANDLKSFMEYFHMNQVDLVGFSDGGNTALQFALNNQRLINHLVLCGANLSPKGLKWNVLFLIHLVHGLLWFPSLFCLKIHRQREIWGLMSNQPNIQEDSLHELNIPVLLIAGENDLITVKHTKFISQNITGSQLLLVPGGNHFCIYTRADEINQEIQRFLHTKICPF